MKKTLREVLQSTDKCVLAPCVYDCASARCVEMVGFQAMMLSGGEVSLAMNGVVDYGFNNLTDIEWIASRIIETTSIPLAADIEDGYGGPLSVYRACKRLAKIGVGAVQLEDSSDMEESTGLLPRELYYEKIAAAIEALKGTDCMLIARTNADPKTQLEEGCIRCAHAIEMGAEMSTVVRLSSYKDAVYVAERVPGWKMYPDVTGHNGVPEVTVEQVYPLGFNFMTTHYTLKAAMDGMLEHGIQNFKQQGSVYTCDKKGATGILGMSATPLFDPQSYMKLEAEFTGADKTYTIVGGAVEDFPEGFVRSDVKDRL